MALGEFWRVLALSLPTRKRGLVRCRAMLGMGARNVAAQLRKNAFKSLLSKGFGPDRGYRVFSAGPRTYPRPMSSFAFVEGVV